MGGEGLERVGRMGEGVDEAGEADAGVLEHPLVVVGQKVGHERDGVGDEVRALDGEVAAQVGGGRDGEALQRGEGMWAQKNCAELRRIAPELRRIARVTCTPVAKKSTYWSTACMPPARRMGSGCSCESFSSACVGG